MGDVDWGQVALFVGVLVPSVILHEVSHGWAALRFGDDTARRRGRLTLNPLAHVDLFGTVLLPLALAMSGFGVIGYAKPVPVNVRKLRKPRNQAMLVALAGPATNVCIALVAAAVVRIGGGSEGFDFDDPIAGNGVADVAWALGLVNVLLAMFNLLPIPPLDGSAVVERLMPRRWYAGWLRLRRYSVVLVLIAVLLGAGAFIVDPAFELWQALV